ncbi:hypothetical protein [Radiobacillus sp. PE A8.2]|uniref:hypothetical protein n=1 Tax=Radiobacillus sp. PE A8.2 TaxID=3380349 RepID=UPI00388E92E1
MEFDTFFEEMCEGGDDPLIRPLRANKDKVGSQKYYIAMFFYPFKQLKTFKNILNDPKNISYVQVFLAPLTVLTGWNLDFFLHTLEKLTLIQSFLFSFSLWYIINFFITLGQMKNPDYLNTVFHYDAFRRLNKRMYNFYDPLVSDSSFTFNGMREWFKRNNSSKTIEEITTFYRKQIQEIEREKELLFDEKAKAIEEFSGIFKTLEKNFSRIQNNVLEFEDLDFLNCPLTVYQLVDNRMTNLKQYKTKEFYPDFDLDDPSYSQLDCRCAIEQEHNPWFDSFNSISYKFDMDEEKLWIVTYYFDTEEGAVEFHHGYSIMKIDAIFSMIKTHCDFLYSRENWDSIKES